MAEETRDLPEMVEKAMGAGGAPMTVEQQLSLEIQDDIEQLPEGVELDTGEEPVVEPEVYNHGANLAEVMDESDLASLASELQAKVKEDLDSRSDWEEAIAK